VDLASTDSLLARAERSEAQALAAPLTTAGLFSGIGGLELGLSRAGHRAVMLCENERVAGPKCVGRPRDAETAAVTYNVLITF
jgi:hypothetical protein